MVVHKKGKVLVKQKVITLDMANDKVVNFHNLKTMVLNTNIVYELDSEGQQEWLDEMNDRGVCAIELESKKKTSIQIG